MSDLTGKQETKLNRRLREYVGILSSLNTNAISTIVAAVNEVHGRPLALSSGGLAIGTTSKKEVKIASTVNYVIAGVFYSKTTAEVAFTATTHDITANASAVQEACYLYSLDTSGNVTVTMGTIASGAGNAVVPDTPANKCPIGYLRLAVAAGATKFDATTDDLDAAHLTDTYVNLMYN